MVSGYRLTTHLDEMDFSAIHAYLTGAYWSENIPYETVKTALENSICFGVLTEGGEQIAFGRVVTDKATFAYLADVYVLEAHREQGIAKWIVSEMMDHPQLQGLRRMLLATADAHDFYAKFGFKAFTNPDFFMEKLLFRRYKTLR